MNPNQTRDLLNNWNLGDATFFPLFINAIDIKKFRKISDLKMSFKHPVTILSGTNKIWKTSIMALLWCSHELFYMRDPSSWEFVRYTWNKFIRFSRHDSQIDDWEYSLDVKIWSKSITKIGKRKLVAKKWSGVGKRESQVKDRQVIFIDTDRISPARSYPWSLWIKTQVCKTGTLIDTRIKEYFEYIFEENISIEEIASYQTKKVYKLSNYSSFNTASWEDVVLKILEDCLFADAKALILIDELELWLHPLIQRRLLDVIFDISRRENKQFIISSHSPTLLSAVWSKSRVFIQKLWWRYKAIHWISVNWAFSKMDSEIFPLILIFCEDDISVFILTKLMEYISSDIRDIHKSIKVLDMGPHNKVVDSYNYAKILYTKNATPIQVWYFAVFDGDKRAESNIPTGNFHAFLPGEMAPEKVLIKSYLSMHPNETLQYHLEHSNPHSLVRKCIDESIWTDENSVLEVLWDVFSGTPEWIEWKNQTKEKLLSAVKSFSEV